MTSQSRHWCNCTSNVIYCTSDSAPMKLVVCNNDNDKFASFLYSDLSTTTAHFKNLVETDFQAHSIHDKDDDDCSIVPSADDSTLQKVPEPLKNSSGYRLNMIIMKDFVLSLCFCYGMPQADTSRNKWRALYFGTVRLFLINLKVSNLFFFNSIL